MKPGPVTKFDKRNKTPSRKFDDDAISKYYEVIVIFLIYGQFKVIRKLNSGCIVYKTYISLIVTFYLTETKNRTKISLTQLSHYCFV